MDRLSLDWRVEGVVEDRGGQQAELQEGALIP